MKRNLLTVALLAISLTASAQVICHVDANGIFYVSENALVYNGGGVQTKGSGTYDIHGNVMVVGSGSDGLKTLDNAGTGNKLDGGNIIVRLNNPTNYAAPSYGQLYINGISQTNITAVVNKEYRSPKNGTYQQIALPFYNKVINTFSGTASQIGTFGKTFSNARYSQNEVLAYNNRTVVSDEFPISSVTSKTAYYMLGSLGLDTSAPNPAMQRYSLANPGTLITPVTDADRVFTLSGIPFANGGSETLQDAGKNINFGTGGGAHNPYNEAYNTYLQDSWDYPLNPSFPWSTATFGKNIYQFGNPYLTNLDLSLIGTEVGIDNDGNKISAIQGIRFDPGTVISLPNGSTYTKTGAKYVNFTSSVPTPVGDVGLIIKPMQTFVIKLRNNDAEVSGNRTLGFDNLRRFKNTTRASSGEAYSVTAGKNSTESGTVKQLGIIGLDADGNELARAYYVVYPDAITGHTAQSTVQSTLGSTNIIGTYEEDVNGGYDPNYSNKYWLYINEANETDFFGKAMPMVMYSTDIKSLKFEVRENVALIPDGNHDLSTGIGFYYKAKNGTISEIAQNQVIPVVSDEYSLYYGKSNIVLGTGGTAKPSRTMVVYSSAIDKFVVRFDPNWNKAEVNVFDMSGKLILNKKGVATDRDFEINLAKINASYIVTAVSDTGETVSSKIIR